MVNRVDSQSAANSVDSTGVKYEAVASSVRLPLSTPMFHKA